MNKNSGDEQEKQPGFSTVTQQPAEDQILQESQLIEVRIEAAKTSEDDDDEVEEENKIGHGKNSENLQKEKEKEEDNTELMGADPRNEDDLWSASSR